MGRFLVEGFPLNSSVAVEVSSSVRDRVFLADTIVVGCSLVEELSPIPPVVGKQVNLSKPLPALSLSREAIDVTAGPLMDNKSGYCDPTHNSVYCSIQNE